MNETYAITIPFIRSQTPPRSILVDKTIESAAKKVREWMEKLEPEFTELDTMQMIKFKPIKDSIELEYIILRDDKKKGGN